MNYLDFAAALTKQEQMWQQDHLKAAFNLFDLDNDKKITKRELKNGFENLKKAFENECVITCTDACDDE